MPPTTRKSLAKDRPGPQSVESSSLAGPSRRATRAATEAAKRAAIANTRPKQSQKAEPKKGGTQKSVRGGRPNSQGGKILQATEGNLQQAEQIQPTIETAHSSHRNDVAPTSETATSEETLPWSIDSKTQEQDWYCRKGYLPSVDNSTLDTIRLVLGAKAALKMARLSPYDKRFPARLKRDRNVHLNPHPGGDPYRTEINKLSLNLPENEVTADVYARLWTADVNYCKGENEAIFQRTVMMSFLDRYRLIFGDTQGSEYGRTGDQTKIGGKLAFSVEAAWDCAPMPTRALLRDQEKDPFLAAPKPDLCVSFRTSGLIPEALSDVMPSAMCRLVCYEGYTPPSDKRAFGFFVVEGKKSQFSPDNDIAKYQALNDASQALHNMYEFFREAGEQDEFFEKVRFFSATTSEKGLIIRIHRAAKLDARYRTLTTHAPIYTNPVYDLEYKFEDYASFLFDDFNRKNVIDIFAKIMIGYGEGILHGLLSNAANWVNDRFQDYQMKGINPALKINDYRHGQTRMPSRKNSKEP
ncbi:MAG: hypothetical protein M1820_007958 [Bogoriella megaspora]|nr:MAG: hypothetical protein M1820_007958 [Bogoriella megaspora]